MSRYFDYAATQPMRQVAIDAWVAASGVVKHGASAPARGILGSRVNGPGGGNPSRVISTPIEHPAVRDTVAQLKGAQYAQQFAAASGGSSHLTPSLVAQLPDAIQSVILNAYNDGLTPVILLMVIKSSMIRTSTLISFRILSR